MSTLRRKYAAEEEVTSRPVPQQAITRKRPRHHTLETAFPLRPLLGVSIFIPCTGRPSTRSPREHRAAVLDDDVEEGECPAEDPEHIFSRIDAHGRVCRVVVATLDDANEFVRPYAVLPPAMADYLPLSPDCYVYTHIRRGHPQVTDVVMCFAASLMRRVLCVHAPLSLWLRVDRFQSLRPLTNADFMDVMRYAICISIANKVYGSRDDIFRPRRVIEYLVNRSITGAQVASMEREILGILDYRIGTL